MNVVSIVIIVLSNVVYNISQKSTPKGVNPFVPLFATYVTAALLSLALLFVSKPERGLVPSLRQLNWTSAALGVAIVGLEFGYLMAYRAGWNISVCSLVANIALALILIFVGVLGYAERFGPAKLAGAALCIAGLVVMNLSTAKR